MECVDQLVVCLDRENYRETKKGFVKAPCKRNGLDDFRNSYAHIENTFLPSTSGLGQGGGG